MLLKRRIWQGVVVALCAWPLLHFALVQRYGISPWKLHGMAMYCAPKLRESGTLHAVAAGRERVLRAAPEELATALDEYMRARHALGSLASARALKRAAASNVSGGNGLFLELQHWSLDPDTRRVRMDASRHPLVHSSLAGIEAW